MMALPKPRPRMAFRWLPPSQHESEEVSRAGVVRAWLAVCGLALLVQTLAGLTGALDGLRAAGYAQAVILAGWISQKLCRTPGANMLTSAAWWSQIQLAGGYGMGAALVGYMAEQMLHGDHGYGATVFIVFPVLSICAVWIMLALARTSFATEDADA